MNKPRDWTGKCQRCFTKSDTHIMSMFDLSLICLPCQTTERKHPDYEKAREAELQAVKNGNRNFKGIGYSPVYPNKDLGNDPVDW